jgi:GMP synthase-like glutamine amidotransferase
MRIGILVTNTDDSAFARRQPKDGEKFADLIHAVRPGWEIVAYSCIDNVFPARVEDCNGYVITGSPASVNGKEPWIANLLAFIRKLDAARKPTAGACFGHQAIAKALGGEVAKSERGWGFGVAETHFTRHEDWMEPKADRLRLFAAHTEQVTKLPPGAVLLGGDAFCHVGSFKVGEHFFTTEYHPEMTPGFFTALADEFSGAIGQEMATKAQQQAKGQVDNALFAEWMARFFEMDRQAAR